MLIIHLMLCDGSGCGGCSCGGCGCYVVVAVVVVDVMWLLIHSHRCS